MRTAAAGCQAGLFDSSVLYLLEPYCSPRAQAGDFEERKTAAENGTASAHRDQPPQIFRGGVVLLMHIVYM